jgi:hypothetical protein
MIPARHSGPIEVDLETRKCAVADVLACGYRGPIRAGEAAIYLALTGPKIICQKQYVVSGAEHAPLIEVVTDMNRVHIVQLSASVVCTHMAMDQQTGVYSSKYFPASAIAMCVQGAATELPVPIRRPQSHMYARLAWSPLGL